MKLTKSLTLKIFFSLIGCFYIFCSSSAQAYDNDAIYYNNIGINYTKKGEYEEAIEYFKKAINSDSSMTNAYYNLGSVYKHTGRKDKALDAFLLLLRNNPDDDEVAYLIANIYFEKQDYEKALIYLHSIDKTSPSYKDAMNLFRKVNNKINDTVIDEPAKPVINTTKYTFTNFHAPSGIAEDSQGNLYVANYVTNSIDVILPDGKVKKTIKNELIKGPVGIAIDSKDNIYVANYPLNNIIKISKEGIAKVILSNVVKPYYLYLNKSGVLYVSEQEKNTVIRIGIPE